MNTLYKRINFDKEKKELNMMTFLSYQYGMIKDFLKLIVEYIGQQHNNYIKPLQIDLYELPCYHGIYNSIFLESNIYVNDLNNNGIPKLFFKMYIPKLIDGSFFYLNGNTYVPSLYVVDFPIIIKKGSIKVAGLFNSITLYMKDDIAIFTGTNIPQSYFLQLLMYDDVEGYDLYTDLTIKYKKKHKQHSESDIINYFDNKFNVGGSFDEILAFLERLFFDTYTRNLYQACYGHLFEINLKNIVKHALLMDINDDSPDFVDLTYKRISFMEILLRPLFDRTAHVAKSVCNGYRPDEIKMDALTVSKTFVSSTNPKKKKKGLSGNSRYDTSNLYSGILSTKISMVAPGVQNAPKSIQKIHPTHSGKICPISISSQKPGHVVSALPHVKLDYFGRFI